MIHDEYQPTRQQNSVPGEPPEGTEYRLGFPCLGQKLLDRYEIFGVRQGGFSVVFFVTDLKTNQDYAVKTYKPEFADMFSNIEQFKAEADFWLSLEPHPHIVSAYFVEVIHNQPYLFMEYVDGGSSTSLRDWLTKIGHFGVDQAIDYAYQLSLGMEFANRKGEIAHCDLKPENILIDRHNVLKVTDFGLIQRIRVINEKYPTVESGTWAYASPELLTGQVVSTRTDIFSFGIIFYEMLTGKLPYPFALSSDPTIQYMQLSDFHRQKRMHELRESIDYGADLPTDERVNQIIGGCLDHYMNERFRDFRELRKQFEENYLKPHSPPFPISDQTGSDDLYRRALSLHKIGRYSEALSLFNRLLQQNPKDGQLWLDTAKTLLAVGQKDAAHSFLQQALHLNHQFMEDEQFLELL